MMYDSKSAWLHGEWCPWGNFLLPAAATARRRLHFFNPGHPFPHKGPGNVKKNPINLDMPINQILHTPSPTGDKIYH